MSEKRLRMKNSRNKIELTVPQELAGKRLDACVSKLAPDYSRVQIQRLIADGSLLLNGKVQNVKRYIVSEGDRITFEEPEELPMEHVEGEDIPLSVLYEDDSLLVIDKPAGMVVHPAAGNWTGTVVNALLGRKEFAEDFEEEDMTRPGIVHRLDKDTSGCLVIAKNSIAMHKLSRSFAEREVSKTYAAIAAPAPKVLTAKIETQIGRNPGNRKKMAVVANGGRDAITIFNVLKRGKIGSVPAALLQVRILTGRTHQIRVHLSHFGSPVIGDPLYGGRGRIAAPRQMLHAWKITFPHPETREMLSFESPFPADFQEYLDQLKEER